MNLEDIMKAHPGWYCWTGLAGLVYARLLNSSPPIVIRAPTPSLLKARIDDYLKYGRAALYTGIDHDPQRA